MRATISATITPEAYAIYEIWAKDRTASENISLAIAEGYAIQNQLKAVLIQRDLYRVRCGKIDRLYGDIQAGIYSSPDQIRHVIEEIWNTHPILVEQKTLEEY